MSVILRKFCWIFDITLPRCSPGLALHTVSCHCVTLWLSWCDTGFVILSPAPCAGREDPQGKLDKANRSYSPGDCHARLRRTHNDSRTIISINWRHSRGIWTSAHGIHWDPDNRRWRSSRKRYRHYGVLLCRDRMDCWRGHRRSAGCRQTGCRSQDSLHSSHRRQI